MDITSILITIVGLIFIIALYVMSRITQSKLPQKTSTLLPDIKDDEGNKFSSVLDDIPARDGIAPHKPITKPAIRPKEMSAAETSVNAQETVKTSTDANKTDTDKKQQVVLFISAKDENGLNGDQIKAALLNHGLSFGDKDIYHYFVDDKSNASTNNPLEHKSLFRVANGVEPWTLNDDDLHNKRIAGLSLVLFLPSVIDGKEALKIFLKTADSISDAVNGLLKNQQQQILTQEDKDSFLS